MFFASCKDPALTMLKSKGYIVVQVPKADFGPTQRLARNGKKLRRIGDLTSVFIPSEQAPPPTVSSDNPGPNISGEKSASIDIGVGLNILGGLISALGASTLGLNLSYKNARKIQFEFASCIENNAAPALLDQFLAGATVNPLSRAVSEMLESDEIYVVTSTLKSAKINTVATGSNDAGSSLDVPVLQQAVGGNVEVSSAGASATTISYEGSVPLVFGFQAVQLIFDDGQYRTMRMTTAGDVSLERAGGYAMLNADQTLAA